MSQVLIEGGSIENTFLKNRVRFGRNTETLAAGKTLVEKDPPLQFLDNGGAVRTVTLPAEAVSEGLFFFIANTGGGAFAITVEDDATGLVASLAQNEHAVCFCDGTTWLGLVGTST
jgi:hypothetical protein